MYFQATFKGKGNFVWRNIIFEVDSYHLSKEGSNYPERVLRQTYHVKKLYDLRKAKEN